MYNAKNAKEMATELPKDSILTGVITIIDDALVENFISEKAKDGWKGDIKSHAINCIIEISLPKESGPADIVKTSQMFTYLVENNQTVYSAGSNMGKFKKKYGKLPEIGDQVKIITNSEGFGKVKLD